MKKLTRWTAVCFVGQFVVAALLLLFATGAPAAEHNLQSAPGENNTQHARPNIIFVLFDDMGWAQPQSYDPNSALRTPHFDKLVSQGMRFTDAHSASAVCTPTRYGALTGRYPSRIGQFGVLTTWSPPIIPPARMTIASLLKQQGYATACVGKWHLGLKWQEKSQGQRSPIAAKILEGPNQLGFDYFCGFTHARNIQSVIEQDEVIAHVEPIESQPLMIEKAIVWLNERQANEPFFLYFPMCPPHTPVAPAEEYLGRGGDDTVGNDPKYGDWVYQGDDMLGQIMQALEQNGMADNTLLIVAADNGAERRAYPPLRASKRSIYEGGHRIPFAVRWPGNVQPGTTWDHTVCINDLLATFADVLDVELPENAGEDSVSFLPAITGQTGDATRSATVHQSMRGDLAIRRGDWKYVVHKNGKRELFNLREDLSETRDQSLQQAEVAQELEALLRQYIDEGRSTPGENQANEFDLTLPPAAESDAGNLTDDQALSFPCAAITA